MNDPDVIDHDLSCALCGYNVRGLNRADKCPECADPVARALRLEPTRSFEPVWLDQFRAGAARLAVSTALGLLAGAFAGTLFWGNRSRVSVACSFLAGSFVLAATGCWKFASQEPVRNRYAVSKFILSASLVGYLLLTSITLLCYWLDEYSLIDTELWRRNRSLLTAASVTAALAGWAGLHRLSRMLFWLQRRPLGVQSIILSYLIPSSLIIGWAILQSYSRLHRPEMLFLFWPTVGVGHSSLGGTIVQDTFERVVAGPRGRIEDWETHLTFLLPISHFWLLCIMVVAWRILRKMVEPRRSLNGGGTAANSR